MGSSLVLLCLLITCCVVGGAPGWLNNFDAPFTYTCPWSFWSRSISPINRIQAVHDNWKEDRRFHFQCGAQVSSASCSWSGEVNSFDAPFTFFCPRDKFIAGISSRHNNHHEDRIFKFYCCGARGKWYGFGRGHRQCTWSGLVNHWDGRMNYKVDPNRVLRGVYSYHNNLKEDRRFDFYECYEKKEFMHAARQEYAYGENAYEEHA